MSRKTVSNPTSRVSFGLARTDITPPANIYHRLWGAARHDRATGVHHPLTAEVMVFGPTGGQPQLIRIQRELRDRFPDFTVVFSPLASELQVAYLLPEDQYGQGLYQEEPSILAPGCLEKLTESITGQIKKLIF